MGRVWATASIIQHYTYMCRRHLGCSQVSLSQAQAPIAARRGVVPKRQGLPIVCSFAVHSSRLVGSLAVRWSGRWQPCCRLFSQLGKLCCKPGWGFALGGIHHRHLVLRHQVSADQGSTVFLARPCPPLRVFDSWGWVRCAVCSLLYTGGMLGSLAANYLWPAACLQLAVGSCWSSTPMY